MAFCSKCGMQLPEKGNFCENCGASVNQPFEKNKPENACFPPKKTPNQILFEREQGAAIAWTVIALIQLVVGITGLFVSSGLIWLDNVLTEFTGETLIGFEFDWEALGTIGLAVLNGYGAYCSFKLADRVKIRYPGIVNEYRESLTPCIVAIGVNIFLGSLIGIAGAVFDLTNRNYALKNAEYLEN